MTITEIYNDHKEFVFKYVLKRVGNRYDAQEIANDVFIKMFRLDSAKFDSSNNASIITWIITVTNSVMFDFFRSTKKLKGNIHVDGYTDETGKESFEFIAPTSTNADKDVLTGETQTQIVNAFHSLKPKYRRVAGLYFISGYKYSEIATMLNVPEGTVKGMINRARAKLQESLKVAKTA